MGALVTVFTTTSFGTLHKRHLWVEGHPRAYAATHGICIPAGPGTFLSRVTLGHMQLRTAYAYSNLKFKFEIQICLVSKLFLCACASGNNANPNLVAKLLPYT